MNNSKKEIIEELTKNLFDTKRWPHYQLMFDHLDQITNKINDSQRLAILERCYIYGGFSIFSSLFETLLLDIYDFIPPNSNQEDRKNYQKNKLDSLPKTIKKIKKATREVNALNLIKNISKNSPYDYIFIPNVIHHHPNPFALFKDCKEVISEKGYIYIFDAILRENHQKPDDFIRFTPDGISYALEENGFRVVELHISKSPVEALLYTLDQVIQYDLPADLIDEIDKLY